MAKNAARARVKQLRTRCQRRGQPVPEAPTYFRYIRPNNLPQVVRGTSATDALIDVLRAYREAHATLPPTVSVCGYVDPEAKQEDEDA